jgi:hypothetical protein
MGLCKAYIVEMSKKTYTDARNQCAVDFAKKVVANLEYSDKEGAFPFI